MKWRVFLVVGLVIFFAFGDLQPTYADTVPTHHWYRKAVRGVFDVALFPLELFRTTYIMTETHDPWYGFTRGSVRGVLRSAKRLGCGLVELTTCAFRYPDQHREPLMEPEFAWQGWEEAGV